MSRIFNKFLIKTNFLNLRFALVLLCFISTLPVYPKVFFLEANLYQDKTQERKIILGKGEIISSDKPITRVAVSDPNIADLQVLNEKQIFVRAKKLGICTILIWEKSKSNPTRFDVAIWPDIDYLSKQLKELDTGIIVEYIPPNTSLTSESSQSQASGGQSQNQAGGALGGAGGASSTTGSSSSSDSTQLSSGKIILKGQVKNAETIGRALQIAGAYVGDQGIKIIGQPGGQVVDGLAGRYDIYSNSDLQVNQAAQGSATAFGARDPMRFTSNRYANLSRGVIATTQKGAVLSFLTVKDPPQVSVAIRFYEIKRDVARNLGFNTNLGGSTLQGGTFIGGNGISQALGSISSLSHVTAFMAGQNGGLPDITLGNNAIGGSFLTQAIGQGVTGVIFNPNNGIGAIIQALQERGEIKTLAEPTLVIANGEPASFLAGGEVPILRSVFTAGGASTDVTYEPFGIKFNILPTVTSQDRIYLQLIPEIRDIDTDLSNLIAPPGSTSVRPPAFKTRRTQTQVELESGQAFAISGLLREDNVRNLRKVPGIGDIPILGTLFRSKSFKKGETELLVVVSPQIVRPTSPDKITSLTRPDVPYHDFDQFAPIRPYIKFQDEKGPEIKTPLDAGKYNTPENDQPKDTSSNIQSPYEELKEKISQQSNSSMKRRFTVPNISMKNKDENEFIKENPDNPNKKLFKRKFKVPQIARRNNDPIKEAKLIQHKQDLQEHWKQELTRYAKAKEEMELARANKKLY